MAMIYVDSFDHYTTPGDKGWVVSGGNGITGGRNGNAIFVQGN